MRALEREGDGAIEAVAGEAGHLADLSAVRVRAARGGVDEYVGGGNEDEAWEEYLRVGRRLLREVHDDWPAPRKTRSICGTQGVRRWCVLESRVCRSGRSGRERRAVRGLVAYILTSIVYLQPRRPLHRLAKLVLTEELEVFRGGVHLHLVFFFFESC